MSFWESAKEGFGLVNRNWQLVIVRVLASLVNLIGFFIIVGIPAAAAIIFLGTEFVTSDPQAFLLGIKGAFSGGYAAIAVLMVGSILVYLTFASFLWMYVLAGASGTLGRGIKEVPSRFRLKDFLRQAKSLFFPFMGLYAIVGIGMMLAFIIVGLATGGAYYIAEVLRDRAGLIAPIIGAGLSLFTFAMGVLVFFFSLAVGAYGTALIIFEHDKPWQAAKGAVRFMQEKPEGFWGYSLFLLAYGVVALLLFLFGYPFKLIPIIGSFIVLPYQLFAYAVKCYISLALIGAVLSFYSKVKGVKAERGISAEAPAQGPAPQDTVPPPEEPPQDTPQTPLS